MRIGKKAILFDRDGVLNIDSGYVYRYENIRWIDGAREAVARLTEEGWLLFVVTNQSGVARGFYTEKDVMKLHKQMNKEFRKYGGNITEFFFCPHLNGAKISRYNMDCAWGQQEGIQRKPDPEAVFKILEKLGGTKEECLYIGDSEVDVKTGHNAGVRTISAAWGFRTEEELKAAGAEVIIREPLELLQFV